MTKTKDSSERRDVILGGSVIAGPGVAVAGAVAGYLDDYLDGGRSRARDLGPAPIGSDPWLRSETASAIAREKSLEGVQIAIRVESAVVTLKTRLDDTRRATLLRAAQSVQGIKKLSIDDED